MWCNIMDYFPLTLAAGHTFCNRLSEQKYLKDNILESRPTLIISPRRYGKTSLAAKVINDLRLHFAQFDFFTAVSEADIEKIILKSIGQLLTRIESGPRKLLRMATELFSGLSIKLGMDKIGLSVEINHEAKHTAVTILDILQRVELLAKQHKKKIILFFDEFQRLYQVTDNQAIEGAIRQIAQASKQLAFVFSGSNRHLLNQVFSDRNRPFYKLCDRINLERISIADYTKYIQKAAKKQFKTALDEAILKSIFNYTEQHPYYVNVLCSRLWRQSSINAEQVDAVWQHYAVEERAQVANELDLLSGAQRKLLIALSRYGGTAMPRGKAFQTFCNMPGTTIAQSLNFLVEKDYVYKDDAGVYHVLDPLVKYVLALRF